MVDDTYFGQGNVLRFNRIYNIGTSLNHLTGTSSASTCSSLGLGTPCLWPLSRDFGYGKEGAGFVFLAGAIATAAEPIRVYQNIVYDAPAALEFRHLMPGSEPAHVQIVNNTFDQTISGFINIGSIDMPTAAGHLMWNNIFTRVSGLVWNFVDSSINFADLNSPSVISIEHNRYFQHAATFSRSGSGSVATFADWLAAVPAQERAAPASRTGDPGFADLMGHDYHLTAASDARLGGVDVLNLRGQGSSTIIPVGAYITGSETVGVRVGISSSRPAAPTNLRRR